VVQRPDRHGADPVGNGVGNG